MQSIVYSMMKTRLEQEMFERNLTYCSSVKPSIVMSIRRKSVGQPYSLIISFKRS
jgi:hypothetical protein